MNLSSADSFQKVFSKKHFRITNRVSNSLDPDQAQHNVRPYLGWVQILFAKVTVKPVLLVAAHKTQVLRYQHIGYLAG